MDKTRMPGTYYAKRSLHMFGRMSTDTDNFAPCRQSASV